MSLNNISLPAQLIADLYEFSLIEREPALSTPQPIKFLGKNEKKILILVSKDNIAFVEDEELDFLSSILLHGSQKSRILNFMLSFRKSLVGQVGDPLQISW